ncbi:MAG: ATP-dependent DNA helicase RecG [Candidatus Xenolissoclinum pacificiensis L6]|uniref:ATP-dependent DNA helicase RecG n=1 Tax=Candidatus Xenolissoclinum pacificiensis L6 TaxID=1401685 RepID=W2V0Y1_9RICK|nr:MAG: ATP-dependent DNA helicase RecG [Candidatus Xenolissoclinum pacificiensis L6]
MTSKILQKVDVLYKNQPSLCEKLRSLCGEQIKDILLYKPVNVISNNNLHRKSNYITIIVKVKSYSVYYTAKKKSMIKVLVESNGQHIKIVFFNYTLVWVKKLLQIGKIYEVCGILRDDFSIYHPRHIASSSKGTVPKYIPLYNSRSIPESVLRNSIKQAFNYVDDLYDWHSEIFLLDNNWDNIYNSLFNIHYPSDNYQQSYARLRYDEFLAYFIHLCVFKSHNLRGCANIISGDFRKMVLDKIPFSLTEDQNRVIDDITQDQKSSNKMMRLIHGDVGSGKTIIALLAMVNAVESGRQAVLLAPTYLLAIQHYQYFESILGKKLSVSIMTSNMTKKKRSKCVEMLLDQKIDLLIGTHAILENDVIFSNLGLVVIDEQHRFGVNQRMNLLNKGKDVDLLMLSATPIPRTFSQMLHNYIDVSKIHSLPSGRKAIDTVIMSVKKVGDIINRLQEMIEDDCRIYWVCPMISCDEESEMTSVEQVFKRLNNVLDPRYISYLHGACTDQEKQDVIDKFRSGQVKILVATTVVEIGIDIPDANIMIIEHAERFGLAQLHQLRGRVGRGNKKSFCVLLYSNMNSTIRQRLEILRHSCDGFIIAEKDLEIRGEGDILGVDQSGFPRFIFSNKENTSKYYTELTRASQHANEIVSSDKVRQYKDLLGLFARDLRSTRGEI